MKPFLLLFASFSALILITISCTHHWKTYIVSKGNHSSNEISAMVVGKDRIRFQFIADSSWYYPVQARPGWNKIRGLSHGHHQNNSSARLAYQCLDDTILVVGAYCYVDGVSPQENPSLKGIIDTIQPGKTYFCEIMRDSNMYIVKFEEKIWKCPAGKNHSWGYLLNPYIGGSFTLDHDWMVKIKDQ